MTRKAKQPRLLSPLAPIEEHDALNFDALVIRYRCRCGNTLETGIPPPAPEAWFILPDPTTLDTLMT